MGVQSTEYFTILWTLHPASLSHSRKISKGENGPMARRTPASAPTSAALSTAVSASAALLALTSLGLLVLLRRRLGRLAPGARELW